MRSLSTNIILAKDDNYIWVSGRFSYNERGKRNSEK